MAKSLDASRRRVLVVDNSADLARAIGEIISLEDDLEWVGYALTGADALAKVGAGDVDLVVLDLGLPDRSGFSVLESLRKSAPGVKVLIYTGHVAGELAARAAQLGAAGCVVKGGDFAALLTAIRSA